jgi:tetratricopeptide (TPR) repeat protein
MKNLLPLLVLGILVIGCQPKSEPASTPAPEVKSLTGKILLPPQDSPEAKAKKDSLLAIARQNFEADSNNLDNIIWLGRRTAYLWRYQDAIEIFTEGLKKFPNSPELYRHRGHRFISIRQFDRAIADFEKAARLAEGRPLEIEPDGIPNKLNQPLSSLQFNIYYHWALAHYLKGEFEKADSLYKITMTWSDNPDLVITTADWQYMTWRRLGKNDDAAQLLANMPDTLQLIENESYYNRLLMYKGLKKPEDLLDFTKTGLDAQLDLVTQGYGVGNWYFYNGEKEKAMEVFNKILETDHWSAFGYLAAEAEVARQGR